METNINPLIEYFYLFGLSIEKIGNLDFYKENQFSKPENLKPELLSKFPPIKKPSAEIDPNIILSHCFPKGFKIIEGKSPPADEYFHFSLDNIPSRHTNNKYIHYSCLIFYESLITYYNIQNLISQDYLNIEKRTSMSEFVFDNEIESPEISSDINKSKTKKLDNKLKTSVPNNKANLLNNFYVPKVLCFSSFVPFPNEFKYLLKKIKEYSMGILGKITVPVEKVIENLVVSIPRPIRGRFNLKFKKDYFLLNGEKNEFDIIVPNFNQYNFHSYRYHLIFLFNIDDIMEIYKSLLLEIPIIFFSEDKEKLTNLVQSFLELLSPFQYQHPNIAILPEDNLGIIEHAKSFCLGINNEWISKESNINFFERKNILIFNKPIRICDIDQQKLDLYYNKKEFGNVITFEELGKINNNSENNANEDSSGNNSNNNNDNTNANTSDNDKTNEFNYDLLGCQLPSHYTEKIKKKLASIFKEKYNFNEYNPKINEKISQEIFYYFLISILQNYNSFLFNKEKEVESINSEIFTKNIYNIPIEKLLKVEDFLDDNKRDRDFFAAFISTNIFKDFLERKYVNRENDKFIFLHFDETILSKLNRSLFSKKLGIEFIENKGLETKTWYVLNKNNNPNNFNKSELNILNEKKNLLIRYYQIFSEKEYKYYLFPILLYDNKFFNNKPYKLIDYFTFNNINLKQCFSETNDILIKIKDNKLLNIYNSDMIVQYKHNPAKSLYPKEIENSIYLLWLKIFCMTFYYCENNEKYLRFYEMIKIVRKLIFVKDNILSLILATLQKYGTDYMIIEFFNYIKNFSYGDYAYLANKLLDTKAAKSKNITIKKMPISNTGLNIFYYKDVKEQQFSIPLFSDKEYNLNKNVRKRTFYSNIDNNNNKFNNKLSEDKEILRYDNPISCPNCGQNIDIAKMSILYDQMDKFEKLTCYICKTKIEPKIRVKIDEKYFTITHYSPYFLYSNMSSNLMSIYGNELDLNILIQKYPSFIFNCCWYFNIKGISYDMMLKYKEEKGDDKEIKKDSNKNIDKITQNKKKRKPRFISLEIEKTNE